MLLHLLFVVNFGTEGGGGVTVRGICFGLGATLGVVVTFEGAFVVVLVVALATLVCFVSFAGVSLVF